jgi:hypothetical protein
MKNVKRSEIKLFALLVIFGVSFTVTSGLYKYEYDYSPDFLLPCILKIFHIPLKQISCGFPLFWLIYIEGIDMIGCGPIVGHFSTYSILRLGLIVDVFFYTLCSSIIVYFYHRFRQTSLSKSQKLAT